VRTSVVGALASCAPNCGSGVVRCWAGGGCDVQFCFGCWVAWWAVPREDVHAPLWVWAVLPAGSLAVPRFACAAAVLGAGVCPWCLSAMGGLQTWGCLPSPPVTGRTFWPHIPSSLCFRARCPCCPPCPCCPCFLLPLRAWIGVGVCKADLSVLQHAQSTPCRGSIGVSACDVGW
jgi:hypothetical protein